MTGDRIILDHGAGGRASFQLVTDLFLTHFGGQEPEGLEDSAVLNLANGRLAFSTDTFVVTPIFFPGGDIGELAVNGTVNDLAMRGAIPLFLSAGFILEEGLAISDLDRVVRSMARAARSAGVQIVTGDTKVVPSGVADRVFINTSGIGLVPDGVDVSSRRAGVGDRVILSGTIGDHGMAIMCQREGLSLQTEIKSDTASLADLVKTLLRAGGEAVHVLRDPTRGGVGTVLNEIARTSKVGIYLDESGIPVRTEVRGACDILGLDPLYVANEGKLLAIVSEGATPQVLEAMRAHEFGRQAAIIGEVSADRPGPVSYTHLRAHET